MAENISGFIKTVEGRQLILLLTGYICCFYQLIFYRLSQTKIRPVIERIAILTLLTFVSMPIIFVYEGDLIGWFFNAITGLKLISLFIAAIESSGKWTGSEGYLLRVLKRFQSSMEDKVDDKIKG